MFAKDPNRRKSRSGSRARLNGVRFDSGFEQPSSSSRVRGRRHAGRFVLYVEGARDSEILECWARRMDPGLARFIGSNTVILGGRRPARAIADFQKRGGTAAGYRGLIVLDRDDQPQAAANGRSNSIGRDAGLELFVWSLRHIESYLLVPAAIRRLLGLRAGDRTVERFIEINQTDDSDTEAVTSKEAQPRPTEGVAAGVRDSLHAKRVLGAGGSLSEALGAELRAGDIARAMRIEDLHGDVRELFDRIGTLSGLAVKQPEVVIRSS